MKVMLVNGSPHAKGCTYTALCEVAEELNRQGIETEIFQVGTKQIRGCTACGQCRRKNLGHCVFDDDCVNDAIALAKDFDGFVFGTPVHYASAGGSITAFMDRFFYSSGANYAYKPGACICSARRAGTTAALDQMNKYLTISNMPVVSSQYWNMVHGSTPNDVKQDLEGLQTMRMLGKNMAWLLKLIKAGEQAGIPLPEPEASRERTNFIR